MQIFELSDPISNFSADFFIWQEPDWPYQRHPAMQSGDLLYRISLDIIYSVTLISDLAGRKDEHG
jgi:hypothetical protein